MSRFVLSVRNTNEDGSFGGEMGDPCHLKIDDDTAKSPNKLRDQISDAQDWLKAILNEATAKSKTPLDVVFFVHGYNVDPEEALSRQDLLQAELNKRKYRCLVVGFDWPTAGQAAAYLYDRSNAGKVALQLVDAGIAQFVAFSRPDSPVKRPDCPVNVSVIAHSMGGYVVREAFRSSDRARNPNIGSDWKVAQMVFVAADVSSSCFEKDHPDMLSVFDHCGRLTNYYSGYDEALAASNFKNMDTSSRVGRVGMPPDTPANDKAVDVDCGPLYASAPNRKLVKLKGAMLSHSWYFEDGKWLDDLSVTLQGKLDRNLIPNRTPITSSPYSDFRINP